MKKYIDIILYGVVVLFGVLGIALMAADGLVFTISGFGVSASDATSVFKLMSGDNPLGGDIAALILIIVATVIALVLAVLALIKVDFHCDKYTIALAGVIFIVGGILVLLTKSFYVSATGLGKDGAKLISLGVGAIISGIASLVAGVVSLLIAVKKIIAK
jgi:hypothetical protein